MTGFQDGYGQALKTADKLIGAWLSAALEDANVCVEMRRDIRMYFSLHRPQVKMYGES